MTENNQFILPGNLVHPNNFRLGRFSALSYEWFAQNNFSTELKSPIPAVQFSFATIFQYLSFVQFCSFSKIEFSFACSLQW